MNLVLHPLSSRCSNIGNTETSGTICHNAKISLRFMKNFSPHAREKYLSIDQKIYIHQSSPPEKPHNYSDIISASWRYKPSVTPLFSEQFVRLTTDTATELPTIGPFCGTCTLSGTGRFPTQMASYAVMWKTLSCHNVFITLTGFLLHSGTAYCLISYKKNVTMVWLWRLLGPLLLTWVNLIPTWKSN